MCSATCVLSRIFLFALLFPMGVSDAQVRPWESFTDLVLPLSVAQGVTLRIDTDLGVIAPKYQKYPPANDRWLDHLTSGVPAAKQSVAALVSRTGWGHAAPYLYAAIYHSLGRIYHGMSSSPMLTDGTELIPKLPMKADIPLWIRVYGNQQEYDTVAKRFGTPTAFYEPARRRLSLCIPRAFFESLAYLQNWQHENPDSDLLALEEYLNWSVMRNASHELTHEVQRNSPGPTYSSILVREGTAMLLMDNVMEREERVKLIDAVKRMTKPQAHTAGPPCEALPSAAPAAGASPWGAAQIRGAIQHIRSDPRFSVTSLLDNDAFLSGDNNTIAARYQVAYLAMRFVLRLPAGRLSAWKRVQLQPGLARTDTDAGSLDQAFRSFSEAWARQYWESPRAMDFWDSARRNLSNCLNQGDIFQAYEAGRSMIIHAPDMPLGYLYTGDVFWRAGKFFIALEAYYAPLRNTVSSNDPMAVLVASRIADGHAGLGRISEARTEYLQVARMPYPLNLAITVQRGRLKAAYYTLTETVGTWASDPWEKRLNGYVRLFQEPSARQRMADLCSAGQDERCMAKQWEGRYEEVVAQMKADMAAHP